MWLELLSLKHKTLEENGLALLKPMIWRGDQALKQEKLGLFEGKYSWEVDNLATFSLEV